MGLGEMTKRPAIPRLAPEMSALPRHGIGVYLGLSYGFLANQATFFLQKMNGYLTAFHYSRCKLV